MIRPESNGDPDQGGGLLQAVLQNPEVRERLSGMPADEKTIAMTTSDADAFMHPSWNGPRGGDVHELETIELAQGAQHLFDGTPHLIDGSKHLLDGIASAPLIDMGFIPQRRVTTLGQGKADDADYRIVGRLGSGGTGVVFQAHQRAIDREVALKVLRNELASNQVSRDRFLTEARVIGGLDHPNVIALHEVCIDESGGLFYSMKRIDGTSWDRRINELSEEENINILLRVADAIRYAHSRGLVHRDIKPENVMLGAFGEVLVADWGLAIRPDEEDSEEAGNHSIGGTPAYMAPELAMGQPSSIGFHSDVYLLGAILFQILTGHPPHHGSNLLACIQAAANNQIRETEIEGELMDIAIKAMATDPAERFPTVDDFIAAIKHQRKHDESVRLVRRACDRIKQASDEHPYEDFRVADALLMEAMDIWPANRRAEEARKKLQLRFAQAAADRGDLDLSISMYEAAGEGDCEEARNVRHRRERRERDSQRVSRYSALFTHSPEAGLLIQMSTGVVSEANQMFYDLFGYSKDEVVGRAVSDLNLWACPNRRDDLVDKLQQDGAIDNFEATFLHTDGHMIHVLISGRVVQLQGESMIVSTIRDISLRKEAENELKKSRQRLKDLQQLAGLATWSYDLRSREVTWSDDAFRLAGREISQGVPSKEEFYELIHPDDRDLLKRAIDSALDSGTPYEAMIRQRVDGEQYRHVLLRGQPIFDDSGKTVEMYGVMIPQRAGDPAATLP